MRRRYGQGRDSNRIHCPTWSGEGDGCGLWSPRRGCGINKKKRKTENGKGRSGNVYQHIHRRKSYPAGRPLAHVVVDVDVHIFNIQTKLKGV